MESKLAFEIDSMNTSFLGKHLVGKLKPLRLIDGVSINKYERARIWGDYYVDLTEARAFESQKMTDSYISKKAEVTIEDSKGETISMMFVFIPEKSATYYFGIDKSDDAPYPDSTLILVDHSELYAKDRHDNFKWGKYLTAGTEYRISFVIHVSSASKGYTYVPTFSISSKTYRYRFDKPKTIAGKYSLYNNVVDYSQPQNVSCLWSGGDATVSAMESKINEGVMISAGFIPYTTTYCFNRDSFSALEGIIYPKNSGRRRIEFDFGEESFSIACAGDYCMSTTNEDVCDYNSIYFNVEAEKIKEVKFMGCAGSVYMQYQRDFFSLNVMDKFLPSKFSSFKRDFNYTLTEDVQIQSLYDKLKREYIVESEPMVFTINQSPSITAEKTYQINEAIVSDALMLSGYLTDGKPIVLIKASGGYRIIPVKFI